MLNNDYLSALFSAAAEAVEEAIINALLAGEDMCSDDGRQVEGLKPGLRLQALGATGWHSTT
ncbi:Peptidase family S58 [compost metagenome]